MYGLHVVEGNAGHTFVLKGFFMNYADIKLVDVANGKEDYIAGLSLLGGEPMEYVNQQGLLPLARRFKETYPDKTIWCYTGYTFETDLLDRMCKEWEYTKELLSYIDVLVDGEFIEEQKDLSLRFKGSRNQRIIDIPASLAAGETILWNEKGRYF